MTDEQKPDDEIPKLYDVVKKYTDDSGNVHEVGEQVELLLHVAASINDPAPDDPCVVFAEPVADPVVPETGADDVETSTPEEPAKDPEPAT